MSAEANSSAGSGAVSGKENPALDRDALYAKSQVYIKRGFRAQGRKEFEEYQLWASLALELLGKAALASVHPALVADPQHYQSLFSACGRQLSPDVRTITAKTLFQRLGHVEKAFDTRYQEFCEQMSLRRNSELHSGESPFSGMPADAWEREFWGAIETILKIQKETLGSWLGSEEAKAPARIVQKAQEVLQWAIRDRIARCKQDFERNNQDPNKREQVIEKSKHFGFWDWKGHIRLFADGRKTHECPACGARGVMTGTLWTEEVVESDSGSQGYDPEGRWYGEPPSETVEQIFSTEEFACIICGLHLFGTKEVSAAGLPEEFEWRETRLREFEEEYNNE